MPLYYFIDDDTGQIYEKTFKMSDKKEVILAGKALRRLFTIPNAAIKDPDPKSGAEFAEYTGKRRGSVGDMWEKSEELSHKRAKEFGEDPIIKKRNEKFKKKTGKEHPDVIMKKSQEVITI